MEDREDCWDDSAILAIYNASIRSHQTVAKSKIKGESEVGGLSRKEKKKLLKQSVLPSEECSEELAVKDNGNKPHSSISVNVPILDESSRAFVEEFLAYTEPVDNGKGNDKDIDNNNNDNSNSNSSSNDGKEIRQRECDGSEEAGASYAAYNDGHAWYPLQGGPYYNCYITVQHHHHHHHKNESAAPSEVISPDHRNDKDGETREDVIAAWNDVCATKNAYDAAIIRYEKLK
jgi:hypothetical protein